MFKSAISLLIKASPKLKRKIGRAIRKSRPDIIEKEVEAYLGSLSRGELDKIAREYEDMLGSPVRSRYDRDINEAVAKSISGNDSLKDKRNVVRHARVFVKTHAWHNINSSWIKSAMYIKKTKRLSVYMVRSMKRYEFDEVPISVWIWLTTLPSNAGTWWWNAGIGAKFSANPGNWARKGSK